MYMYIHRTVRAPYLSTLYNSKLYFDVYTTERKMVATLPRKSNFYYPIFL